MDIALCYENVDPTRGGCETYIADLTRRLVRDGHQVHLYACRWHAAALPRGLTIHALPRPRGPRFLRPWQFGWSCLESLKRHRHDVSMGFDKTFGQDIHYPQGGVYIASQRANRRKYSSSLVRHAAGAVKWIDPAVRSYTMIEQRQYRGEPRATPIAISEMTRWHMTKHYGIAPSDAPVLHAAIDPARMEATDRFVIRQTIRTRWGVEPEMPVALFMAMNYRLKGLEPLLHAMQFVPREQPMRLVIAGHPRSDRYQRLACRLGVADRVHFHGFCPDARAVYFAADFLVHPTFYDPCSLVALEAIACGLPVVTTRFNGASELLDPPHDSRIIHDPHDHRELAEAITDFLDRDRRMAASKVALQSAQRWTFDDHYRKMMAILEGVATRKYGDAPLLRAA